MAHSPDTVERALQVRAIVSSNREACTVLAEQFKLSVSEGAIAEWLHKEADRYAKIRADFAPKIHAEIASHAEDLAQRIAGVEHDAVDRIEAELPKMDGKDASVALKNLSFAKKEALDKALVLRGRPNHITNRPDPLELIRAMKQLGIAVIDPNAQAVEGTAEEVEPAELDAGLVA